MMRRRALLFLLALGTVAGYASGFSHLAYAHRSGHGAWSCSSWRDAESNPASWAPPPAAAPAAPQAQAPAPPPAAPQAPAQPGPG